jgi:hypothetical protein
MVGISSLQSPSLACCDIFGRATVPLALWQPLMSVVALDAMPNPAANRCHISNNRNSGVGISILYCGSCKPQYANERWLCSRRAEVAKPEPLHSLAVTYMYLYHVYRVTLAATQPNSTPPPHLGTWPINKTLQPTTEQNNNAIPSSDTQSPLLSDHRGVLMTKQSKYLEKSCCTSTSPCHCTHPKPGIFHTSRPLYSPFFRRFAHPEILRFGRFATT